MLKISANQKRNLAIATAIATVGGIYFLKKYLLLIAFAAIVAFMFNPIFQKLLKRGEGKGKAAGLTLVISFIALLIPLGIILSLTIAQLVSLLNSIDTSTLTGDAGKLATNAVDVINNSLNNLGVNYQVSQQAIGDSLKTALENFSSAFISSLGSIVSSFGAFVTSFIIYIYVFMSLLINQDRLASMFQNLNPLGKDINALYKKRIQMMTKAMVRGQFIIAFVQGLTDTIFLYIAGFKSLFFFFLVVLTVLSIIPLGAGVIVFPIGFIMLLTGHIWQGLLLILGHMFIVGNEDNIMRPKLVPREARLDPALTMLSVFSGLAFFGFIGIVLGPVLMIVIVTTIEVYLEVYKNITKPNSPAEASGKLLKKLKFWDQKPASKQS
jgi:predicted PurR-regulated permease PerM